MLLLALTFELQPLLIFELPTFELRTLLALILGLLIFELRGLQALIRELLALIFELRALLALICELLALIFELLVLAAHRALAQLLVMLLRGLGLLNPGEDAGAIGTLNCLSQSWAKSTTVT